jgi:hypothetical protein
MQFGNTILTKPKVRYHESSSMREPRNSDATGKAWLKGNDVSSQFYSLSNSVSRLNQLVEKLRRRIVSPALSSTETAPLSHPFKIYQPDNVSDFSTGIAFPDGHPEGVVCNIDGSKATDFSATPPTVNPSESWRFWAVRTGYVEYRPLYHLELTESSDDLAYRYTVDYTDRVTATTLGGTFDDNTTSTVNPPLICTATPDATHNNWTCFSLWIQITADTKTTQATLKISGKNLTTYGTPIFNAFPDASAYIVPVGVIVPKYDIDTGIVQYLFGHAINRYAKGNAASWTNSFDPHRDTASMFCGVVNIRGTWDAYNDETLPADLRDQVFYPGDCIVRTNPDPGLLYCPSDLYQYHFNRPDFWPDDDDLLGTDKWFRIHRAIYDPST